MPAPRPRFPRLPNLHRICRPTRAAVICLKPEDQFCRYFPAHSRTGSAGVGQGGAAFGFQLSGSKEVSLFWTI